MPSRVVHQTDGLAWLAASPLPPDHALVTSLPDLSELSPLRLEAWRGWFVDAAAAACRAVAPESVAVFYQTDIKHQGLWIDKAHLVQRGAEAAGVGLLWHKLVLRAAPGATTFGRPAYAHLLAFSAGLRLTPGQSSPDVLPGTGAMPWPRAMGVDVCDFVARWLLKHTSCRVVVDPFCGVGTMLAVANRHGLDAVGVELSRRRAERARALTV